MLLKNIKIYIKFSTTNTFCFNILKKWYNFKNINKLPAKQASIAKKNVVISPNTAITPNSAKNPWC